jgi:hypothetical protein
MRRTVIISILLSILSQPSAFGESAYSEVLAGSGTVYRKERGSNNAGPGTRLYEGDSLSIPDRLILILPYGAATVTKRRGLMRFLLSRREGCGIRMHVIYGGGISAFARPKTCAQSSMLFESFLSGAYFSPWFSTRRGALIPGTLIAAALETLSGSANFSLADRETSSVLLVRAGEVQAQNENVDVKVVSGQGNITPKGQPPGLPIDADNSLNLGWKSPTLTPTGVRLNTNVNPLNTLLLRGAPYDGEEIKWPVLGNSLQLEVQDLEGRSRGFSQPVPRRR